MRRRNWSFKGNNPSLTVGAQHSCGIFQYVLGMYNICFIYVLDMLNTSITSPRLSAAPLPWLIFTLESIMLSTKELLYEAKSLPVEDRANLVDSLLKTLNVPDSKIDREWIEVAERRLIEIKKGKVKPIAGEKVFKKNPGTVFKMTFTFHPNAVMDLHRSPEYWKHRIKR
jgi:hypothetical protein